MDVLTVSDHCPGVVGEHISIYGIRRGDYRNCSSSFTTTCLVLSQTEAVVFNSVEESGFCDLDPGLCTGDLSVGTKLLCGVNMSSSEVFSCYYCEQCVLV